MAPYRTSDAEGTTDEDGDEEDEAASRAVNMDAPSLSPQGTSAHDEANPDVSPSSPSAMWVSLEDSDAKETYYMPTKLVALWLRFLMQHTQQPFPESTANIAARCSSHAKVYHDSTAGPLALLE